MHYTEKPHLPQIDGNRSELKIGREEGQTFPFAAVEAYRLRVRFRLDASVRCPALPPLRVHRAHRAFRSIFPVLPQSSLLCGLAVQPDAARLVSSAINILLVSKCGSFCRLSERQCYDVIGWAWREELAFATEAEMLRVLWPLLAASALGKKNVFPGAGSEDQRIPGANCFFEFKVQDADNESKTCHHAADSDRSGGAFRGNGGAGCRPAPSTPCSSLSGYGKECISLLGTACLSCLLLHHCNTPV